MAVLPRQKRGPCVRKTKGGKDTKWTVVVDGQGVPIGADLDSAWPSQIELLEPTIGRLLCREKVVVGLGQILSAS